MIFSRDSEGVPMMKIGRIRWIKIRFCPDCGKLVIFAKNPNCVRCKKCSIKAHNKERKKSGKIARKKRGLKSPKSFIREIGYCELCGTTKNLTVHHVGGKTEHLTCLCDDCHQIYEATRMRRKARGIRRAINEFKKEVRRASLSIVL